VGVWQTRRARKQAELADEEKTARHDRAELERLAVLLRRTRQLFVDQAVARDRLMALLQEHHPTFRPSERGFEYWFSELYEAMTPEERRLHQMVLGYTEESLVPANRELQLWLSNNPRLRRTGQAVEARADLVQQLDLLEQHLDGWFVKFHKVFAADKNKALPQDLEPTLEAILGRRQRET
jgi:hypothetical protein